VAPTAAPEPDRELVGRARRAVAIRIREKLEKGAQSMRDPGAFAGWYLRHLLANPSEIDEVEERERIRQEVVKKVAAAAVRAAAPVTKSGLPDFGAERDAELARLVEEARRRRNRT
jgi:hypothetical protein